MEESHQMIFVTTVARNVVRLKKNNPGRSSLILVLKNLVVNGGLWGSALTPAKSVICLKHCFLQGKPRGVMKSL